MSQERNHELASALQAIDDLAREKKEYMIDHKARVDAIWEQIRHTTKNILTGQGQLPLDTPIPFAPDIQELAARVGEKLRSKQ